MRLIRDVERIAPHGIQILAALEPLAQPGFVQEEVATDVLVPVIGHGDKADAEAAAPIPSIVT